MRKVRLTRRNLLKGASALTIAAPALRANAAAPISPIMTTLSTYMANAATHELPPAVVEKAKQMILDALGAMISGSQLPPGQFAHKFARAYGGEKVSTVVASNIVCGPVEAAMCNGLLAHSDETDDTHPPSQS